MFVAYSPFRISRIMIYFDHNASTPLCPEAKEAISRWLGTEGEFGNPSSIHQLGRLARDRLECARADVASLLGATPSEIVFTSGGTEANNLALACAHRGAIVTTPVEHPSVSDVAGPTAERVPVTSDGLVDPDALASVLRRVSAALVSVQAANHETGVRQPIREIAQVCRNFAVPLHVDAVQAAGKVAFDLTDITLASISAHKIYGPKGIGALFVRRGFDTAPLLRGGHQEREQRPGTENLLGAIGFAAAARAALAQFGERQAHITKLWQRLEAGLAAISGARIVASAVSRTPGTTCVIFSGLDGETLTQALDLEGFCVSTGAACSSGSVDPSPVLLSMGVSSAIARQAIRISAGYGNTEQDVDKLLMILPGLISRVGSSHG